MSIGDDLALPSGWCWATADALCDGVDSGSTPQSQYFVEHDNGTPFLKVYNLTFDGSLDFSNKPSYVNSEYERGKMNRSRVLPGDVLTNIVGPPLGKVSVVPDTYSHWNINQAIVRFRPLPALHNMFLSYFLQSSGCKTWLKRTAKTTTSQVNLATTTCRRLPVPVPPRSEQDRIVEELESYLTRLDDAVATLERVERNLERYRASVLKAAVEGRLVPTEAALAKREGRTYEPASVLLERILSERRRRWSLSGKKGKYQEPTLPDTRNLPDLPEGWCWTSAEAISDETRSITYGVIKLGEEYEDGVPTLRSSNVRSLWIDSNYVKTISPQIEAEYQRTRLLGGEILITVRGTLGGVVVAPAMVRGFNVSREVAMIALAEESVGPCVALFIASSQLQNWMLTRARGIAYQGINIETLKELPIPLPPLAEQQRIQAEASRQLSVVIASEGTRRAANHKCARLRLGILEWAFQGKLADQNPGDEPASVLIDRIKAERGFASLAKETRSRRGGARRQVRA